MKSYEILPAGVDRAGLGGRRAAPKAYEMMPESGLAAQGLGGKTKGCGGNGGCGCEGSCGGKQRLADTVAGTRAVGQFPNLARLPDLSRIAVYGPNDPNGPAANPCQQLVQRIAWLRAEIDYRRMQLGPRAREIAEAWQQAREICDRRIPNSNLCAMLVERQFAAGMALSDDPSSIGAYNAAVWAALRCRPNMGAAEREAVQWGACWAAIARAQAIERRARGEMMMSPEYDYSHDILPLEIELTTRLQELGQCQRSVGGMNGDGVTSQCNAFCHGQPNCSSCCSTSCFPEEVADCQSGCGYR